jgi:hypothetical protein
MRQALHIFWKDVRHLKWELLLMLSLVVAFVAAEPRRWRPLHEITPFRQAEGLIQVLMGLAWCYLVVRLIHEEAPAGDRQFWITRPYSWKSLWAAKLLFIFVFINVPVLVADAMILVAAGFSPSSHLLLLVWKQIALAAGLAAAVAVAAVTRRLLEFGLAGLIIALYSVVLEFVYRAWPLPTWIQVSVFTAIIIAAASALVLYQYARRRTVVSRVALVCLALVMLVAMSRVTWNLIASRRLAALAPQTSGSPMLVFDPNADRKPANNFIYTAEDIVPVSIPLQVAGLPEGTDIASDVARASIDAPGNRSWHNYGGFQYSYSTAKSSEARLYVNTRFFDEIKSTPVTVRFSVLLTLLRDQGTTKVALQDRDISMDEVFKCLPYGTSNETMLCRTPLFRPRLFRIGIDVPESCHSAGSDSPQGSQRSEGSQSLERTAPRAEPRTIRMSTGWYAQVMDFEISPVTTFYTALRQGPRSAESSANQGPLDCPGAQVEFTTEGAVAHIRRDIEIRGLRLADYAIKSRRYR